MRELWRNKSKRLKTCCFSVMVIGWGIAMSAQGQPAFHKVPNNSYVTVSGIVASTSRGQFTLDYGKGLITIELDDWDPMDEASQVRDGEYVVVNGRMDADLYEARSIEAERVYIKNRNVYVYASATDEEGGYQFKFGPIDPHRAPEGTWITLLGNVREIDGREFELATGSTMVTIDTGSMPYNPLDDVGNQQLKKGDQVFVTGRIDISFFEGRQIEASQIVSVARVKRRV